MTVSPAKPRLLTGDTPTGNGKLHLGHWIGSLENRVALQSDYECYFIIANLHALITLARQTAAIRAYTLEIALDYLAVGIDPSQSVLFVQSEVPAIAELTFIFSMLLSASRVLRNPTLRDEIHTKGLGDNYPLGFLLYPVGQIADILAFRPTLVPVGEDQLPHLELAREVARRFNQWYCGVDPQTPDEEHLTKGGLLPIIQTKVGRVGRLVGLGPPNAKGVLLKMSKSSPQYAIWLSDEPDVIKQKVMSMYTDPKRLHVNSPGTVENNPLWLLHQAFNPDQNWLTEAMARYRQGQIGDVECKRKLIDVLVAFTAPIRERRRLYANDPAELERILYQGTVQANVVAEETLAQVKAVMPQSYFKRRIYLEPL